MLYNIGMQTEPAQNPPQPTEHAPEHHKSPWITLIPTVLITYAALFGYNYLYRDGFNDATWSESLAATAGILIGLSFVASALSYFFKKTKLMGVRKQMGLYGFWIALVYCFSLQYRFPDKYFTGLQNNLGETEVILGLAAMFILGFMTLISSKYGVKVLGPIWWRRSLRLGYVAYLLLIIRAYIVEQHIWSAWWENPNFLAPPRLLLSVYATLIILGRLAMEVSLRKSKPAESNA